LIILATTAAMSYIDASLLRLHRDSVAQDRFRRFLAPEVIDEVLAAPEITLGAAEKEVTVLFSDITGFTRMSSGMSPQEVVGLLNEYFPPMAEIVFRYGGTLEKYIGDAVLAEWGAPITRPDDPRRALTAAVQMMHKVRELNRQWEAQGQPAIQIHVGIHTGKVAAGNIGSDIYLQYATIGDTTNVASRICSAAEGGQVLISEETRHKLGEPPYPLEKLPPVAVKGKEKALKLYRVKWEGPEITPQAV
jgi:adenylate cyclase